MDGKVIDKVLASRRPDTEPVDDGAAPPRP